MISTTLPNLPLERSEKLRIFGIVGVKKDIPLDLVKEKISLSLVAAYSEGDALLGAKEGIRSALNANPEDYHLPYIHLSLVLDSIIPPKEVDVASILEKAKESREIEEKKEKTKSDLIAYVRFVFDEVGTDKEIEIAETVINKFKDTHLSPLKAEQQSTQGATPGLDSQVAL